MYLDRVDFVVSDEFEVVLTTKESEGIPGYMPNKVARLICLLNKVTRLSPRVLHASLVPL